MRSCPQEPSQRLSEPREVDPKDFQRVTYRGVGMAAFTPFPQIRWEGVYAPHTRTPQPSVMVRMGSRRGSPAAWRLPHTGYASIRYWVQSQVAAHHR